jgi:hypothetical protein
MCCPSVYDHKIKDTDFGKANRCKTLVTMTKLSLILYLTILLVVAAAAAGPAVRSPESNHAP